MAGWGGFVRFMSDKLNCPKSFNAATWVPESLSLSVG